ncbi:hypothetical protein glysoja_044371 [Glycine soja]|uniref:Uncharacterized protein n=1 Tax=Glycine soja TaxID=3848 RepID=A0A0B2PWH9_GLYSO|nr:hypothetical protein glysoja_044371 [Glycine soja]
MFKGRSAGKQERSQRTVESIAEKQGMAFARAVTAGFEIDYISPLMSFAECFGASRMKDARTKFRNLWRRKHETG